MNPDINIAIVIPEAKKYAEFVSAGTLDRAVSAFVRDVERPADVSGQIANRLNIAQKLLPTGAVVAVLPAAGAPAVLQNAAPGIAAGPPAQAQLSSVINGFDCAHYPGDDIMDWLRNNGDFPHRPLSDALAEQAG